MKIRCVCCHGTAEVTGTHQFRKLPGCRNETILERGGGQSANVRAKRFDLIRFWDETEQKFVPLLN